MKRLEEINGETFTLDTSFPNRVSILEAGNNVVLNLKSELQAIAATFF